MKQAVVLIHGIGEQKPMDTLRRFADAVLGSGATGKVAYRSKPDRISESFELRRLRKVGRPRTDFYEYYWAYNVEGTSVPDVLVWLAGLLLRSRRDVPPAARSLWWAVWALSIAMLALLLLGGFAWLHNRLGALQAAGSMSAVVVAVSLALQWVLVAYIGDAARYLSPRPRNIRLRQSIRAQGVRLLRELQSRGPQPYDRVVLVGHSLESVIAYDLINHFWQECHEDLSGLADPAVQAGIRDCLAAQVSPQPVLRDRLLPLAEGLPERSADGEAEAAVHKFQSGQRDAWRELRGLGNPWRISDLITAGSPLAHAMLLMAGGMADLAARKRERELPTCPPQLDEEKGFAYSRRPAVEVGEGRKFTPLIYHHAAPFAVTRWTNLYFPVSGGIFGDLVGGPLAPVFGPGIRDVAVRTTSLADRTFAAHTRYWHFGDRDAVAEDALLPVALTALKAALALDQLRHFRPRPPSVPRPPGNLPAGPTSPGPADPPGGLSAPHSQ